jgi:hypothetical protein
MDWYIQRGLTIKLTLNPVDSIHTKTDILNRNITFSLLGFAVLFISAMNYIPAFTGLSWNNGQKTIAVKKDGWCGQRNYFLLFCKRKCFGVAFFHSNGRCIDFFLQSTLEQNYMIKA